MTASANGAILTGPTSSGSITDAAGNTWTLSGAIVYENGSIVGINYDVAELVYVGGVMYQKNTGGNWYKWTDLVVPPPNDVYWPATTAPVIPVTPPPTQTVTLAAGQSVLVNFGGSATITISA
jgi:hypothetical protein